MQNNTTETTGKIKQCELVLGQHSKTATKKTKKNILSYSYFIIMKLGWDKLTCLGVDSILLCKINSSFAALPCCLCSYSSAVLSLHVQVVCSLDVASPPPSPKAAEAPLCVVMSDGAGHFIFYPLPPGTYSVVRETGVYPSPVESTVVLLQVPMYKLKDLHFEVHPMEIHFSVSNDSVILPVSQQAKFFYCFGFMC